MKLLKRVFEVGYSIVVFLFVVCGASLVVLAVLELWEGLRPGAEVPLRTRFHSVLETIGLLTVSVAALELGQTILEEEVERKAQVSTPTRARRFVSRFMVVVIVALSIEALVGVFELLHEEPEKLPHAATIALSAAALLAAWGAFIRMNKDAEELEPEAMEETKREDQKFQ